MRVINMCRKKQVVNTFPTRSKHLIYNENLIEVPGIPSV